MAILISFEIRYETLARDSQRVSY